MAGGEELTAQDQQSRAEFEDGKWYWVEHEGWSGQPALIEPARYKADCDAWYSIVFSGISTRFLKVLEPCERQAAQELVVGPCGQCKDDRQPCHCAIDTMLSERGSVAVNREHYLSLAKQAKAAQERKPLTDERIREIDDETHFHEAPDWPVRFARAIEAELRKAPAP